MSAIQSQVIKVQEIIHLHRVQKSHHPSPGKKKVARQWAIGRQSDAKPGVTSLYASNHTVVHIVFVKYCTLY